jgi:hypothetical protein
MCVIIFASTFIPRGSWSFNPKLIEDQIKEARKSQGERCVARSLKSQGCLTPPSPCIDIVHQRDNKQSSSEHVENMGNGRYQKETGYANGDIPIVPAQPITTAFNASP